MLLIIDLRIPGVVRERMLVSYHRYQYGSQCIKYQIRLLSGCVSRTAERLQSNIDDVCKMLRSTGFVDTPGARVGFPSTCLVSACKYSVNYPINQRPPQYPEDYFARHPVPSHFVQMLISRLLSDDVYNLVSLRRCFSLG